MYPCEYVHTLDTETEEKRRARYMQKQMGEWMTTHSKGETEGRSDGRSVIGNLMDRDAKAFPACTNSLEWKLVISETLSIWWMSRVVEYDKFWVWLKNNVLFLANGTTWTLRNLRGSEGLYKLELSWRVRNRCLLVRTSWTIWESKWLPKWGALIIKI